MCYLPFSEFLLPYRFTFSPGIISLPLETFSAIVVQVYWQQIFSGFTSFVSPFLKTIFHYKSFQIYKKVENAYYYSLPKFYHWHLIIIVLSQIYHLSISLSIIYLIFYANKLQKTVNFTLNTLACEL